MKEEIVFSVFQPGVEVVPNLRALLKQFEEESQIGVQLEIITWEEGWSRLLKIALHGTGPDLSEIGNTWVKDLARMNALRPFARDEMMRILGGKNYFQASWPGAKTVEPDNKQTTWAIPFISDARMLYYRRDLLQKAGIDETTAFQSIENFENTMATLKASGVETALVLPTQHTGLSLQTLASWIWSAGGDFFGPDGTKLAFDTYKALDGIKAYFRLGRYMGKYRLSQADAENLFPAGKVAAVMSGYWVLETLSEKMIREKLGIASVLGTSFVGAEHLVVWRHSRNPEAAMALAQFLSRAQTGKTLFPSWGLPPYRDGWQRPPFNEPLYSVQMDALQHGRSFPDSWLWALIEKHLSDLIPLLWEEVLADPDESDKIVEREITALARRLRITLES